MYSALTQPSISELDIHPLKLSSAAVPKEHKVGNHSESEQRGMMKTCREAEKPLSGSILSLPEKVKAQGECQPMHR